MLQRAKKRLINPVNKGKISLLHEPFQLHPERGQVDAIFASYALSMINPGYETVIDHAWHHLKPGGYFAVVDFHKSNWPFFKAWMGKNHVKMDAHLLPEVSRMFKTTAQYVKPVYGGLWHYFLWVGRKV
jgi:S-adenosylmethionine-diacylgycerolhomoserine-N-methlytransferase